MNCGRKAEQYDTNRHFFFFWMETVIPLGTFSTEKLTLGFYEQLLTWWQPYLLQFTSWKGEFSDLFTSSYFFHFIFSNLDLYCHSKFIKQVHRHPKPDMQEQSRGNDKNMSCDLLGCYSSWALVLLASTQFTK